MNKTQSFTAAFPSQPTVIQPSISGDYTTALSIPVTKVETEAPADVLETSSKSSASDTASLKSVPPVATEAAPSTQAASVKKNSLKAKLGQLASLIGTQVGKAKKSVSGGVANVYAAIVAGLGVAKNAIAKLFAKNPAPAAAEDVAAPAASTTKEAPTMPELSDFPAFDVFAAEPKQEVTA